MFSQQILFPSLLLLWGEKKGKDLQTHEELQGQSRVFEAFKYGALDTP